MADSQINEVWSTFILEKENFSDLSQKKVNIFLWELILTWQEL